MPNPTGLGTSPKPLLRSQQKVASGPLDRRAQIQARIDSVLAEAEELGKAVRTNPSLHAAYNAKRRELGPLRAELRSEMAPQEAARSLRQNISLLRTGLEQNAKLALPGMAEIRSRTLVDIGQLESELSKLPVAVRLASAKEQISKLSGPLGVEALRVPFQNETRRLELEVRALTAPVAKKDDVVSPTAAAVSAGVVEQQQKRDTADGHAFASRQKNNQDSLFGNAMTVVSSQTKPLDERHRVEVGTLESRCLGWCREAKTTPYYRRPPDDQAAIDRGERRGFLNANLAPGPDDDGVIGWSRGLDEATLASGLKVALEKRGFRDVVVQPEVRTVRDDGFERNVQMRGLSVQFVEDPTKA